MTAGRRSTLITFERSATAQDAYGEEIPGWAQIGQREWAAIFWGRGDERRQAAAEQGQQTATFQVLANAATRAVTIKDRIMMASDVFDIVGIAPDTPKRGEIEFTAVRGL